MKYLINFLIDFFEIHEGIQNASKETELAAKLDLSLFLGNVVVSLLGTVVVGLFVYIVVTRNRVKRHNAQKEMERLTLLDDLEQKIREIHSEKSVVYPAIDEEKSDDGYFEFRSAFDDKKWDPSLWAKEKHDKNIFLNGRRMCLLREDGARAGSDVLHESLLWFRNLKRGYEANVIDQNDLYILWRQIFPFLIDNRYTFFKEYFNEEDVEPMRYLGEEAIKFCMNNSISKPLEYISDRFDEAFKEHLDVSLAKFA